MEAVNKHDRIQSSADIPADVLGDQMLYMKVWRAVSEVKAEGKAA